MVHRGHYGEVAALHVPYAPLHRPRDMFYQTKRMRITVKTKMAGPAIAGGVDQGRIVVWLGGAREAMIRKGNGYTPDNIIRVLLQ